MSSPGATCIIPLYNEEQNIGRVVNELKQLPFLKQIICVDDGSADRSAEEVAKHLPDVTLVQLEKNMGKSHAVRTGLKHAEFENILLFDADLQNILHDELITSFRLFLEHQADMLILGWHCPNPVLRAIRGDIVISGGRWLKKQDLEQVFELLNFEGFALEVAINHYMIQSQKTSCWFQTSAYNTLKTDKYGVVKGVKSTLEESLSLLSAQQFNVLDQFINFKPKKVAPVPVSNE